jgi:amidohydrolase
MLKDLIKNKSEALFDKVLGYREHLHRYPELSYQEYETMDFVCSVLDKIGIAYTKGIAGTGIVGFIPSSKSNALNECVALRADLDALPILEENENNYKSTRTGIMHACGHDVHTAILLGVCEILNDIKEELPHSVKIIFQPGEEKNPGGASLMIAENVLNAPKVKEIYALHVFPDLPVGNLGFKEGLYMASCDEIYLTIIGKGGHGATPNNCIDPIAIGATVVTTLQQIISRKCDPKIPSVLTFGHFEALGSTNVIPSKAILKGTFRTMDEHWRKEALELIEQQIKAIVEGMGGKAELEISKGYPFLENDPELTRKTKQKAIHFFGEAHVFDLPIRLSSEDFAFYAQQIPACFFRLGVRNEEKGITYGVHHPKFDIDPQALKIGMCAMTMCVLNIEDL